MDVGRINLFKIDLSMARPPIACKPYPILLKYQKFVNEEIKLLENVGWISKSLFLLLAPVIIVPKRPDLLKPQKQNLQLVLDHRSLNMSINTAHNVNYVISYYPLPNITDLLARLQNCIIFSSLDLSSGYHLIWLTWESRKKMIFPQLMVNGTGTWLLLTDAHLQLSSAILCCRYCQVWISVSHILMTYWFTVPHGRCICNIFKWFLVSKKKCKGKNQQVSVL